MEPFAIQKQINLVAYCLELPTTMKVHPIFYISLVESYQESIFPERIQCLPPNIEIENHEEYEVEMVLDSRHRHEKSEYLVL